MVIVTHVWSRRLYTRYEGENTIVNSIAFSPDGKYIASGSDDRTILVWDAETGELTSRPFEGHTNAVISAAFSPNGKYIASASWDSTIRVWNAEAGNVFYDH
jgi:WD40 repeat protein